MSPPNPVLSDRLASGAGGALWGGGGPARVPQPSTRGGHWLIAPLASPLAGPVNRGGGGGILHTVPPPREAGDRD